MLFWCVCSGSDVERPCMLPSWLCLSCWARAPRVSCCERRTWLPCGKVSGHYAQGQDDALL